MNFKLCLDLTTEAIKFQPNYPTIPKFISENKIKYLVPKRQQLFTPKTNLKILTL